MKRGEPWYKRYPRDVFDGTRRLSLEQRGAYNDILDLIYMHDGPIPDDEGWMAHALHISKRKWTPIRKALLDAGKITISDGKITNARADSVIQSRRIQSEVNRETALNRERAKREKQKNGNKNNGTNARNGHHARATDTDSDTESEGNSPLELDAARDCVSENGIGGGPETRPAVVPKFVSEAAMITARKRFPGWDAQTLLAEFIKAGFLSTAKDPDAAFLGFMKKRTKGRDPWGKPLDQNQLEDAGGVPQC